MKRFLFLLVTAFASELSAQIDPVKYPVFTDIQEALASKEPVKSMSFRERGIFDVPKEIGQLDSLFFLNLMGNNLEKMSPEIFSLTELQYLNLNKNGIKYIPAEIRQLQQLETLQMSIN